MENWGVDAAARFDALVEVARDSLVVIDFDGTLAPIVDDPDAAHIHPDGPAVLEALAARIGSLAILTGRPVEQVLALGGLEHTADRLTDAGTTLRVIGQYGNEQWSSEHRQIDSSEVPEGLAEFIAELPAVLEAADVSDAFIEDKGIAIAVHTRRLPDPVEAFERALPALQKLAATHDLLVEPGKHVVEVRAEGMNKGYAIKKLADEVGAKGILFIGDDRGDLEAFLALADLGQQGLVTLGVCADTSADAELIQASHASVDGPDEVLELLRRLTGRITD